MAFQKFANDYSNCNDDLLGNNSKGIVSGSAAKSAEVNGAIRQNNLALFILDKLLSGNPNEGLFNDINYNTSFDVDLSDVEDRFDSKIDALISRSISTIKNYNQNQGSIKVKFDSIESRLNELGFNVGECTLLQESTYGSNNFKLASPTKINIRGTEVYADGFYIKIGKLVCLHCALTTKDPMTSIGYGNITDCVSDSTLKLGAINGDNFTIGINNDVYEGYGVGDSYNKVFNNAGYLIQLPKNLMPLNNTIIAQQVKLHKFNINQNAFVSFIEGSVSIDAFWLL